MTHADKILIGLALLTLPILYLHFWGSGTAGEMVLVRSTSMTPITLPLDQNKQLEIEGVLGISLIEIRDRQVRFIDSPCQNKQCVNTGWLHEDGQLAACLPNGVTIQIIGRDLRFDAMGF